MARSQFGEIQVIDTDFLSEVEHQTTDHYFIDLADVADTTYSGSVGKYLKTTNSGIEFSDIEWDTVSGISSHGQLTDLTNDDHIQYVPTNAGRGFTSTVSGIEPSEEYHLTTKYYVDSLIDPTASGSIGNILFGSEFSYEEDDTISSTNSIDWQDKLTLTADDLIEGSYRLGFYFLWDHSKSNTEFGAQVVVDDTSIIFEQNTRTARSGYYDLTSGFYYYENVVSGTHFATIKYKSSDTGSTSYIKQARLEFWRVS